MAIEAAGGWEWRSAAAHDPLGREIEARWLVSADGSRAVVELAAASGLSRLAAEERDPVGASTFGTGRGAPGRPRRRDPADRPRRRRQRHHRRRPRDPGRPRAGHDRGAGPRRPPRRAGPATGRGGPADRLGRDEPAARPRRRGRRLRPAEGRQRGRRAEPRRRPRPLGRRAGGGDGRRERDTPGAGAAGGTVFGLACLRDRFRSFAIVPGVDLVMEATGFAAKLAGADLVLTGEGRIDGQTAFGKTALGVARRAAAAGVPCVAVGGGVEPEGIAALAAVGRVASPWWSGRRRRGGDGRGPGAPRALRRAAGAARGAGPTTVSPRSDPAPRARPPPGDAPGSRPTSPGRGRARWSAAGPASCPSCWRSSPACTALRAVTRAWTPSRSSS